MDKLEPEIVKTLLNALVSPRYPELIHDYMITSSEVDGWRAFAVGVIVDPEKYEEMETYTGNPFSGLDSKVEKDVKDVLKYVGLGPTNSTVSLYVLEN
jgi:hypothetical protein